jgi:hypothetical protein
MQQPAGQRGADQAGEQVMERLEQRNAAGGGLGSSLLRERGFQR